MLVIAVDAGAHSGVVALSVLSTGKAWLLAPPRTCSPIELAGHVGYLIAAYGPALVVVEVPSGTNYGKRPNTAALLNARGVGERLAGFCEAKGLEVITCSANEWRKALGCMGTKAEKGDHAVTRMVKLRFAELPRRLNSHERDAMGCGVYGAMRKMAAERRSA